MVCPLDRRSMRRLSAWLLVLLLAGCSLVDTDQIRLCRLVLPALHPDGAVLAVTSVSSTKAPNSLRIAYRSEAPGALESGHVVVCRFAGGRFSLERQVLAGLVVDGESFGPVRLHLLKRYWLDEPDKALLAPPLSEQELADLPQIRRDLAIALQYLVAALPQIAIYVLLAPAYALIYGLTGRINLAFGELAIIGGQGALLGAVGGAMLGGGSPLFVLLGALLLALAAAATHGDLMAQGVFAPLRQRSGQAVLVASVGLTVGGMEYVRLAQGDSQRWTPPLLNTPVNLARAGDFIVTMTEGAIMMAFAALVIAIVLLGIMRRSAFGRQWRASADEPLATALFGVDPRSVLIKTFMLASLLVGFAGFIMTAHYGGIGFSGGLSLGLKALIAAILGGIGSVGGAMLGAVLIGSFEALWSAFFPLEQASIAVYTMLVLLLILRPGGLFGWRDLSPRRV